MLNEFILFMLNACAGNLELLEKLVKQCNSFFIVYKSIIYFIHQSIKDFVLKHSLNEVFFSGDAVMHYNI